MIRAFDLALRQLGDPELRGVLWQSLLLSLVLQVAIAVLAWWALQHFAVFQWEWVNAAIRWLGGAAVVVLALLLFPASFGIVISIFLERIAFKEACSESNTRAGPVNLGCLIPEVFATHPSGERLPFSIER